jgi:hypothetical protein
VDELGDANWLCRFYWWAYGVLHPILKRLGKHNGTIKHFTWISTMTPLVCPEGTSLGRT